MSENPKKSPTNPESSPPNPENLGPQAAEKRRKERLAIGSALLDRDDYTYQVFYSRDGNREEKPVSCPTISQARKVAKQVGGRIEKRIKKSGCRKFADFYRLCLPKDPVPHSVDLAQLGNFIFQTERGTGWIAVKVMRSEDLTLMKAEYSISVVTPDGRSYAGVGACAISDGRLFKQPAHVIPATAFTRALNRAITEAVGWGAGPADEADDEEQEVPSAATAQAQSEKPQPAKDPSPEPQPKGRKPDPQPQSVKEEKPLEPDRIAPTQLNTIKVLASQMGMADDDLDREARAKHGKQVGELSQKEGFSFIHHLVSIKNRKAQTA